MTVSIDAAPETTHNIDSLRSDPKTYQRLESILLNTSGSVPLHERFRALFTLKSLGTDLAVDVIAKGFADPSALLKHELAYVLGQMKLPYANTHLTTVLETPTEEPMVRHEAAEALGAIGDMASIPVLKKYLDDEEKVVSQTCELAIEKILYEESLRNKAVDGGSTNGPFMSIDPAPPLETTTTQSVDELKSILLDENLALFKRYRAMFSLRNIGTEEAVLALAEGFHDSSALFRHEIAYVFGQLQHPASVPSLITVLQNQSEQAMVRHEAAEALGSIGTKDCYPALQTFAKDSERVVRESCEVGLDMWEHENSGNFQYADKLAEE